MARIRTRGGLKANLPTTGMLSRELMVTTDQGTLHVAVDATTKLPVVPAIEDLASIPAVDGAADYLLIHDASEDAAQKQKKVTVNSFRAALNIPVASSDEKVAVAAGGTAGYPWGTDGTDGVFRMNSSLSWTKDASNGFITMAVNEVDCGTF